MVVKERHMGSVPSARSASARVARGENGVGAVYGVIFLGKPKGTKGGLIKGGREGRGVKSLKWYYFTESVLLLTLLFHYPYSRVA